jgi:hypothetical protein
MKNRLRKPSPPLVISLIALFVALGGTSYAATALAKNSVGTAQLKKNAVIGSKIRNGAVTAGKINPAGLTVPSATNATNASSVGGLTADQLQQRVTGTCSAGSAIRIVNSNGTVTCQASGTTVLWAVVTSNGILIRGSSGTNASETGTGQYLVGFNRDVSGCAYSATIGSTSTGTAHGSIDVASFNLSSNGVSVDTFAPGGVTATAEPFHLVVVC